MCLLEGSGNGRGCSEILPNVWSFLQKCKHLEKLENYSKLSDLCKWKNGVSLHHFAQSIIDFFKAAILVVKPNFCLGIFFKSMD